MFLNYEQRNSDFLQAVRRVARRKLDKGERLQTHSLVKEALASPAPSYYVTAEYIWRRIKDRAKGYDIAPGPRRDMLDEIAGRLDEARGLHPETDPFALLDDILGPQGGGASRFFIGQEYALRLFTGSARRHRRRKPASRHDTSSNAHSQQI